LCDGLFFGIEGPKEIDGAPKYEGYTKAAEAFFEKGGYVFIFFGGCK
jgi:hypothetical protein